MRPQRARTASVFNPSRKCPAPMGSVREGICARGNTGTPSMSTMWHPMLSRGMVFASSTASAKAAPVAISVEDVTTPRVCASKIARFTPEVYPKSSALMISRRTQAVYTATRFSRIGVGRVYSTKRAARCLPFSGSRAEVNSSETNRGRLAQLVRAPALQAGGRRFESCTAHQFFGSKDLRAKIERLHFRLQTSPGFRSSAVLARRSEIPNA
jgi:hypothetical protein